MKKLFLGIFTISAILIFSSRTMAQCPGCAINPTCYVAGGGLCPDSLPGGTQGVYYDEDVTAYLPSTIDATALSGGVLGIVPLQSVHIDGIAGLPFGLNWTCDHPGNNFTPSTGDTLGCVKVCGVPLGSPGVYNIVVTVTAGVYAGGVLGTQYAQVTFNFQIVIAANSSGNLAFNYSPTSACDSAWVNFTPNITGTLPQVIGYNWDFGGGNVVSTLTTPAPQYYGTPGDYPVTLTTNIYNLALTEATMTASGDWWTGDIEETCILSCPDPDLFFRFSHGSNTYTSSEGSDNTVAGWNNLNVLLSSTTVAFACWDADTGPPFGSPDDDGGTATMNVTGIGVYGYQTTTPLGGYTGGASGSFTIGLVLDTQIIVTDTIHIYASPPVPTITASAIEFCPGDSVVLTADSGYAYEWYRDTVLLQTGTSNTYVVHQTGDYSVRIFNPATGCTNSSATTTVTMNAGIPWNFAIVWNTANSYMASNAGPSYNYQWMFFNGTSWVNIPAPAGIQSTYTPTANGQYRLIATNAFGCTDTTAIFNFNSLGIPSDLGLEYAVNLFPNPSSGEFTLSMNLSQAADVKVMIYDMTGRQVFRRDLGEVFGVSSQFFTLYELNSGSYLVDVIFPQGIVRKKLIIH